MKKFKNISSVKKYGFLKGMFITTLFHFNKLEIRLFSSFIRSFFCIKKNVVIFYSTPDYSDNARALYDYMQTNDYNNSYKMWFAVEDLNYCKKHFDNSVKYLGLRKNYGLYSLSSLYTLLLSETIVYTHKTPYPSPKFKRLKNQKLINLWHGCGYKDSEIKVDNRICSFDFALVPGPLFIQTKMKFWNAPEEKIIACGYPRYDWMLYPSKEVQSLVDVFKDNCKKLIIWMPTFRNDKHNHFKESTTKIHFPLVHSENDWKNINQVCKNLNLKLVVKSHQYQKDYGIDFEQFSNIDELTNNMLDDYSVKLYEFISFTDALITDYSSVAIDYLILNKPIAFALEDFEEYKNNRGFIFEDPLMYMPGHHMFKIDDLLSFLFDISNNNDQYKLERDRVKSQAIFNTNCYCKSIIEKIGF